MSFAFEKMVAGRYLRSKRKEGFISIIAAFSFLGILLGVATLIIVMSVMNGFRDELIGRILGLNGHINVYSRQGPMYPYEPLLDRIRKIPGVTSAIPTIEGQALLRNQTDAAGVVVRGLRPADFLTKPILSTGIQARLYPTDFFGDDKVAIGVAMASRMNLDVGDKILLVAPTCKTTPFGCMPKSKTFIVGAIFDVGMYEYNNSFVYVPMDMAQAFFDTGQGVSAIEIMTPDSGAFQKAEDGIKADLGDGYVIADWQNSNASLASALDVERNVMFLILTLIILVASFNIISSLIMLVKDKGRDIAILRTMGATRGMVIRIFFYTGASIGIFGTLAGTALGVAFAANIEAIRQWLQSMTGSKLFPAEIYFLSKLPAKMEPDEVILITGMALVLTFAATIYPAWRAAKLDPVEALRRE